MNEGSRAQVYRSYTAAIREVVGNYPAAKMEDTSHCAGYPLPDIHGMIAVTAASQYRVN